MKNAELSGSKPELVQQIELMRIDDKAAATMVNEACDYTTAENFQSTPKHQYETYDQCADEPRFGTDFSSPERDERDQ